MTNDINEIYTDQIDDPINAMRGELDRESLFDLAENIKQNGLINPITVRPVGKRFEVVAGHRRLSACKIAGILKIPCCVRDLDDNKTFEVMAAENLERTDVDPVDEANFLKKYIEQTKKTVSEVAKSLRRSESYILSRLAISEMPDYLQAYLKSNQVKLGVALVLNQITVEHTKRVWVEMAVRDGISVAQAEYWLHGFKMSQLPGGILADNPSDGFEKTETPRIQFECAIDGKKYDARYFQSVMIFEDNMPLFNAFVSEIRKENI